MEQVFQPNAYDQERRVRIDENPLHYVVRLFGEAHTAPEWQEHINTAWYVRRLDSLLFPIVVTCTCSTTMCVCVICTSSNYQLG